MSAPVVDDIERLHDRRWWTLAVLCLSLLIVFVGNSSLNVALPTLSRELRRHRVAAAVGRRVVLAGVRRPAVLDRRARRPLRPQGRAAARPRPVPRRRRRSPPASTSMWQLIACRAVMGVGAAFIMPSTLSILVNVFPPDERTKAIAIWASVTGAAGGFGPVASGWLLGHFWYGSVFLVNVPIIAVALVAGRFLVPRSQRPARRRSSTRSARCCRSSASWPSSTASSRRPSGAGSSAPTLVAFAVAVVVLAAVRALGAAHRRADARHAASSGTRRSAPAPAA